MTLKIVFNDCSKKTFVSKKPECFHLEQECVIVDEDDKRTIYPLLTIKEMQVFNEEEKSKSLVYNPSHYNLAGRKSCWEEMYEAFGVNATVIFDCLNAYKYRYRAGNKDGNPEAQDKEKIKNYMEHALDLIDHNNIELWCLDVYAKMATILKGDENEN